MKVLTWCYSFGQIVKELVFRGTVNHLRLSEFSQKYRRGSISNEFQYVAFSCSS